MCVLFILKELILNRFKQLGKDSIIYGLGGILAKSVSFFMLPIYTRIFSRSDYGTIEMLIVISSFVGAILVMGMDSAQSMYFFKNKEEGKSAQVRLVSSILQWRLLWGTFIVLLSTLLAPLLNLFFFNGNLSVLYFAIAFSSALFAQVMSQSSEVMRLLYRPWSYIGITISQSLFAAGLIMVFVLGWKMGVLGFFIGVALSSVLVSIFGWYLAREYLDFSQLQKDLWPKLIRFGAPLVPAGLALYFMSSADRWFIQYFHGPSALGLFAVGAKFSMLMAFAAETFRKAWWPIAMDSMHNSDGPETFRMISRLYMGLGTTIIIIVTLLSPWLVELLTTNEYYSSWPIVGILAWQSLFYGFFLIASAGIWKVEKTSLNLYLMLASTTFGLVLNWLLVPKYAELGAAIATAITYLFWVVISMLVSEFYWKTGFSWMVFAIQVSCGVVFVVWYIVEGFICNLYITLTVSLFVTGILLLTSIEKPKLMSLIRPFKTE